MGNLPKMIQRLSQLVIFFGFQQKLDLSLIITFLSTSIIFYDYNVLDIFAQGMN